jgi:hypothetical protein
MAKVDATLSNHGSIVLLHPTTDAARAWLEEHVSEDSMWFGNGLVIEPRYLAPLVEGMRDDGLLVA